MKKQCPVCKEDYQTETKELHQPGATPTQDEQHITGICSDDCWDLAVPKD